MQHTWITDFKENALFRMEENIRMVSIALAKIGEDDIWTKQNRSLNPLGNQILHICGNMTQYVIAGLGEQPDERVRDVEFNTEGGLTKDELLQRLLLTEQAAKVIIQDATEEQLLRKRSVQGFNLSGQGLVIHAIEHFSYHTGQIACLVKMIRDEPLGFYAGLDLNARNE